MGCTERRVLVLGSIVFLLALAGAEGAAAPAADGATPVPSPLPVSPTVFAEQAADGGRASGARRGEAPFRNALELIFLAATCGLAVACYSAFVSGHVGKRMLMRIRRR